MTLGVAAKVGTGVGLALVVSVGVCVAPSVLVGVSVAVAVGVADPPGVSVSFSVAVLVIVGVAVAVALSTGVTEAVAVSDGVTSGVAVGVSLGDGGGVAVGVALDVAVSVAVAVPVGVGLTGAGQPSRELLTPSRISLTPTVPSPFASKAGQALTGSVPRSMSIPIISSSMVTSPELLQSPTQAGLWVGPADAMGGAKRVAHATHANKRRRGMLPLAALRFEGRCCWVKFGHLNPGLVARATSLRAPTTWSAARLAS